MTNPAEPQPTSASPGSGPVVPTAPVLARQLFGARLELAELYAARLAGDGTEHGHIGPREIPRLWERHLINSAVVAQLLPQGAAVLDVGSGAGLPGLPIAISRPDVQVNLLEPMLRRCLFLSECIAELGIDDQVTVRRGRAEDRAVVDLVGTAEWVVARAVAPLDRLAKWCLPLLAPGGTLLAMKGSSAMDEATQHRNTVRRLGGEDAEVLSLGGVEGDAGTWVVSIRRPPNSPIQRRTRRR